MMALGMISLTSQAQTKFCTSYADYKTGQWKPYEELIPGKEPDSIRIKYDGKNFILRTSDKEVNKAIKNDVFMMQIDKQLFINQCPLRDDPLTFEMYYGRQKKGERQSASNILPILVKKGLIQDYHHQK